MLNALPGWTWPSKNAAIQVGFVAFLHGLLQSELTAVTQLPHAPDLCADLGSS